MTLNLYCLTRISRQFTYFTVLIYTMCMLIERDPRRIEDKIRCLLQLPNYKIAIFYFLIILNGNVVTNMSNYVNAVF